MALTRWEIKEIPVQISQDLSHQIAVSQPDLSTFTEDGSRFLPTSPVSGGIHPLHPSGGIHPLSPSGGVTRRRVVIDATISVTDDETFGSNEHASGGKHGEAIVTHLLPQELITMVQTCGGEVRIELRLNAQTTTSEEDVIVTGDILLYEGTSEQTDDLDGQESVNFIIPRDSSTRKSYTVRNQNEGGDFAVVTMTAVNSAA